VYNTHEEVIGLDAEEFTEVAECNGSVGTETEVAVLVSGGLTTALPAYSSS